MKKTNKLAKFLGMFGVAALALGMTAPVMASSGNSGHGGGDRDFRFRIDRRFDNDFFDRDFRIRREIRIRNDNPFLFVNDRFDRFDKFDRDRFDKFNRFNRFDKFHDLDRGVFFRD